MVKKQTYMEYCAMCQIPLLQTEQRILDHIANKQGWFDEDAYLSMTKSFGIYVTAHQRKLLRLMPQRYKRSDRRTLEALGRFMGEVARFNDRGR